MNKKRLKINILALTLGILTSVTNLSTTAYASELNNNINISSNDLIQTINEDISKNVEILDNSIEFKNTDDLLESIDDSVIDELNNLAKQQGIDKTYTKEELLNLYETSIDSLNNKINAGELELLDDGSLIDANDDSFYLQGGSTFDKSYWWGVSRWKSTYYANEWAYELNKAAAANAGVAVIAGAVLGGLGAVPNGITSAYCWALANEVSYRNSLTTRGIVADINWAYVYSVYGQ